MRNALFVIGILAGSIASLAQGRGTPAPPPPLEAGASQADVDKALIAAPSAQKDQATVINGNRTSPTRRSGKARTASCAMTDPAFPSSSPFRCSARASPTSIAWRRI